jgi:hypothetical protein
VKSTSRQRARARGPRCAMPHGSPWSQSASDTGSGSVAYHYTTNPGGLRTGTITIAGLTFTVTQPQAP